METLTTFFVAQIHHFQGELIVYKALLALPKALFSTVVSGSMWQVFGSYFQCLEFTVTFKNEPLLLERRLKPAQHILLLFTHS